MIEYFGIKSLNWINFFGRCVWLSFRNEVVDFIEDETGVRPRTEASEAFYFSLAHNRSVEDDKFRSFSHDKHLRLIIGTHFSLDGRTAHTGTLLGAGAAEKQNFPTIFHSLYLAVFFVHFFIFSSSAQRQFRKYRICCNRMTASGQYEWVCMLTQDPFRTTGTFIFFISFLVIKPIFVCRCMREKSVCEKKRKKNNNERFSETISSYKDTYRLHAQRGRQAKGHPILDIIFHSRCYTHRNAEDSAPSRWHATATHSPPINVPYKDSVWESAARDGVWRRKKKSKRKPVRKCVIRTNIHLLSVTGTMLMTNKW